MMIFLIGYMGVGKSSVGRSVAGSTGMEFVDMDREIEQRLEMSIAEIFRRRGEEYFRECEKDMMAQIIEQKSGVVVATGGGTPCFGDSMESMLGEGVVVYLKMSSRNIITRLKERAERRERRPMIAGMDDDELERYVEESLAEREAIYQRAHLVLDCDLLDRAQVEDKIVRYMSTVEWRRNEDKKE